MVSAPWLEWEGRIVEGKFPLLRYLGDNERSGVFLTQIGEPEPRNATIKLVRADALDQDLFARYERAAQLSHPHLIRLFQLGSCHIDEISLRYVVTEYAEEDLATVLQERPLTSEEARNVLESVLDVLAYLHGQGLVHARLKPGNILAVNDRLKISCDGIRATGDLPLTAETTGAYDPPEVHDKGYSPAADIWSLGITLVEALTQRLPGPAGLNQKLILPETLPVEFREITDSCLQAEPLKRATVASLAAQLRQSSDRTPENIVEQSPVNPRGTSWRWRYAVPATALGLATMFAAIGLMHRRPESPQAASAPPVQRKVQEQPEQKRVAPPPARRSQTGSADRMASPGSVASVAPVRASANPKSSAEAGVVHPVMPEVPGKARDTIHGTVRIAVRAHVDASGRVTSAELASAGPSSYFAELTLRAVRRWEFEPANAPNQDAARVWLLKFELTRGGTKVRPVRVSP